jgi:sugar phosphate isomerase/epimerase
MATSANDSFNLAVQLYTLREFTKTPADIASTLARVKKIGYDAVQVSAIGKIDPAELAKILRDEGLTCCATHVSPDRLKAEPRKVIDEHRLWSCGYTAIGGYFTEPYDWPGFIRDFNAVAAAFANSGLRIGYHNHSHELAKFNGATALSRLVDGLSNDVWFELDTYWLAHGGADPAAWIAKLPGRVPCVHLKDMGITPARRQFMAEVGEGNLNWPAIFDACKSAGVKWHIVEQDDCNGRDPFESLAISLRNLRAMGL